MINRTLHVERAVVATRSFGRKQVVKLARFAQALPKGFPALRIIIRITDDNGKRLFINTLAYEV